MRKNTIKLNESDLVRIIKLVMEEDNRPEVRRMISFIEKEMDSSREHIKDYQDKLNKLSSNLKMLKKIVNPNVMIAHEKKTNILKASTIIKTPDGKNHKINVHIGKYDNFSGGVNDPEAISIGTKKINNYIDKHLNNFLDLI